jgi:hypothetical protein
LGGSDRHNSSQHGRINYKCRKVSSTALLTNELNYEAVGPADLKKAHFLSSPKSLQTKKAKISTTKLNLKAQNIYIKPLLKL